MPQAPPNAGELARHRHWPLQQVADFYGLTEEHVRSLSTATDDGQVDRFEFEKRLQIDGLTSLDLLALEFGVPTDGLENRMKAGNGRLPSFQLAQFGADGRYLLLKRFAEAWVKELLPKQKTWSSLDSRARDLAGVLGTDIRPCETSIRFNEVPPAVATCRCIVTWKDVSRAHQEYLENGKPMSLEPDHVGWHAIYDDASWRTRLWANDLTNFQQYLVDHRVVWPAA